MSAEELTAAVADACGVWGAWSDAHVETESAWAAWKLDPSRESYCVYRAAADREDCALEWLAGRR
jgi:hypothetical protein